MSGDLHVSSTCITGQEDLKDLQLSLESRLDLVDLEEIPLSPERLLDLEDRVIAYGLVS